MGLLTDLRWWRYWRNEAKEDEARRKRAFADGRFILTLTLTDRAHRICFTPRYDEAETFLARFVVPFLEREGRLIPSVYLNHVGPWQRNESCYWSEFLSWGDVRAVKIETETDELRTALDGQLNLLLHPTQKIATATFPETREVASSEDGD